MLPEFKGAAPTAEFLKCFDLIFDACNSQSKFQKYSKAPLQKRNQHIWEDSFYKVEAYIRGLRHANGKPVIKGPRSIGFIGWLINIRSLRHLFEMLVDAGDMQYICTAKLQQDNLEHTFGGIRAACGHNNNPNAQQFKGAFSRILLGALNRTSNGNCHFDDSFYLLSTSNDVKKEAKTIEQGFAFKADEMRLWTQIFDEESTVNEFTDNVLPYLSGFIQRVVLRTEKCLSCASYLMDEKKMFTCPLIKTKERGGLIKPNREVVRLVTIANTVFQTTLKIRNIEAEKNTFQKLSIQTEKVLKDREFDLFTDVDTICNSKFPGLHSTKLKKKILSIFWATRVGHYLRLQNSQRSLGVRHRNKKSVINQHE